MIFISDVHYQIEYLNSLPENKGPIVILGDLINWIDYRDGQGIAMDVFGKDNVNKLINLRKEHKLMKENHYGENCIKLIQIK